MNGIPRPHLLTRSGREWLAAFAAAIGLAALVLLLNELGWLPGKGPVP